MVFALKEYDSTKNNLNSLKRHVRAAHNATSRVKELFKKISNESRVLQVYIQQHKGGLENE